MESTEQPILSRISASQTCSNLAKFSESTSRCGHTLVDSNNWGPTSCDLLFSILGALGFSLGKFACGTRTAKRMGTPFGLTMFRFNIFVRRLSSGVQASLLSCIESDGIYTVLVI